VGVRKPIRGDLDSWLGLGGERRSQGPKREPTEERAPVHHSKARTTANPIRRMGTPRDNGWRESSRRWLLAGAGRVGQARAITELRIVTSRHQDRAVDRS
jgi:hypothetical protein